MVTLDRCRSGLLGVVDAQRHGRALVGSWYEIGVPSLTSPRRPAHGGQMGIHVLGPLDVDGSGRFGPRDNASAPQRIVVPRARELGIDPSQEIVVLEHPIMRHRDTGPGPRIAANRTRETRSKNPHADAATARRQVGRWGVSSGPGGVIDRDRWDQVSPPRTPGPSR